MAFAIPGLDEYKKKVTKKPATITPSSGSSLPSWAKEFMPGLEDYQKSVTPQTAIGEPVSTASTSAAKTMIEKYGSLESIRKQLLTPERVAALKRIVAGGAKPDVVAGPIDTPESPYGLRREAVEAAGVEERAAQAKALAERSATMGWGKGSGILEKQQRLDDVEQRRRQAMRLGGIDIAEAEAGTRISEADKDRELTRDLEEGRISIQEKQLAMQADQFASQQDFVREMTAQGYNEAEIARAWQANENVTNRLFATQERVGTQDFQKGIQELLYGFNVNLAQMQRGWSETDWLKNAILLQLTEEDLTSAEFVQAIRDIGAGNFENLPSGIIPSAQKALSVLDQAARAVQAGSPASSLSPFASYEYKKPWWMLG